MSTLLLPLASQTWGAQKPLRLDDLFFPFVVIFVLQCLCVLIYIPLEWFPVSVRWNEWLERYQTSRGRPIKGSGRSPMMVKPVLCSEDERASKLAYMKVKEMNSDVKPAGEVRLWNDLTGLPETSSLLHDLRRSVCSFCASSLANVIPDLSRKERRRMAPRAENGLSLFAVGCWGDSNFFRL